MRTLWTVAGLVASLFISVPGWADDLADGMKRVRDQIQVTRQFVMSQMEKVQERIVARGKEEQLDAALVRHFRRQGQILALSHVMSMLVDVVTNEEYGTYVTTREIACSRY